MPFIIGAFVLTLFIVGIVAFIALTSSPVRTSQDDARQLKAAVRLLDQGLVDPLYRQSEDWTKRATKIVDEYNDEGDWI